MELKIEYLPIEELKPYLKNARLHSEEDVYKIRQSIERYGFNDPIGIWKDNVIVEGHGRLLAAEELNMETVPVIRLDHLTDEQRREYAIAHNRTAEFSKWDFEVLEKELEELDFGDFDLEFKNLNSELSDVDWDNVEDITSDNFQKPEKEQLECPACHHIDNKEHFKKV